MTVGTSPRRHRRDETRFCVHCGERMPAAEFYGAHVCQHAHVLTAQDIEPRRIDEAA